MTDNLRSILDRAVQFRAEFLNAPHDGAFRLLNGYTEELPGFTVDILAKTAVIQLHSDNIPFPSEFLSLLLEFLPWLKAVLLKQRTGTPDERRGILLHGVKPDTRVAEHGVRYAVDVRMNQDNSFYADTRLLRKYLLEHSAGKDVLNTFAYTGSLGAAAAAGHAASVLQTDLSMRFLALAQKTYSMNAIRYDKKSFLAGDFFPVAAKLKKEHRLFDCVILDPPFFSRTDKGAVDQASAPLALINKLRPLIRDGGELIAVNNSLYLSGEDYLMHLRSLCCEYLQIEDFIAIPQDFTGPDPCYMKNYAASPAPFNHPTKIVRLRIRTK